MKEITSTIFLLTLTLFIFACGNESDTPTDKCDNKCTELGIKECNDTKLMICEKDTDGCFVLTETEVCGNTCENGKCIEDINKCEPSCSDWEECVDSGCKLIIGRCLETTDCNDENLICNSENNCISKVASCADGVKNGNETDIDCGGDCSSCGNGSNCNSSADCASEVCSGNTCQASSCADGVKNGHETDVDCGGNDCPSCL